MKVQTNLKSGGLLQDFSARLETAGNQLGQFVDRANQDAAQVTKKTAAVVTTVSGCLASALNRPA